MRRTCNVNSAIDLRAGAHLGALPSTVRGRLDLFYDRKKVPPHKKRLLSYVVANPGALTHKIAHHARVAYPPSPIGQLNRDLPEVGLRIEKTTPHPGDLNPAHGSL